MNKYLKLFISILIPQVSGITAGIITAGSVTSWYTTLEKPFFNPPNWIFAPVWTILYLLMGISFYWIWKTSDKGRNIRAKYIFFLQLFLNFMWSVFFFGLQSPLSAFVIIVLLWFAIILMIREFNKVYLRAGLLQIPYLLWVTFATFLNLAIVILN